LCGSAHAQQSRLPPCPADQSIRWHNCQGTYTWPDGRKYVGELRDDKLHGQGTFTYSDGRKYVGEFRDDKRNGQGILYSANGSVVQTGIWSNGEFVRSANVTPR
jgi:hypothetical protein